MTELSPAFAVGDKVTVVGHYVWSGKRTHGRDARVVRVLAAPGEPVSTIYECEVDGFVMPVPLVADELALARAA